VKNIPVRAAVVAAAVSVTALTAGSPATAHTGGRTAADYTVCYPNGTHCTVYDLPWLKPSAGTPGAIGRVWGKAVLTATGSPSSKANVITMVDWFFNEGDNPPHGLNNPLNSNVPFGGSSGSGPDDIQNYPSPYAGVRGIANQFVTIAGGSQSYTAILANLRAGEGLEGKAATPKIASELKVYSGNGYNSIPAAYCPCKD
jgi:hypothetical protein